MAEHVLIAGPYTPPACRIGDYVHDALRHRRSRVTLWKETAFGLWPAVGRTQPRPIVCDELRRAVETESAAAVALHWRVNISTVVDWRSRVGVADPRMDIPGTVQLRSAVGTELNILGRPEVRAAAAEANGDWTPAEDAALRAAADPAAAVIPGRSPKAVAVRASRLGLLGPAGRPANDGTGAVYGCWRVVGPTSDRHPSGEILWSAACVYCGAGRVTTLGKLKRPVVRHRGCRT